MINDRSTRNLELVIVGLFFTVLSILFVLAAMSLIQRLVALGFALLFGTGTIGCALPLLGLVRKPEVIPGKRPDWWDSEPDPNEVSSTATLQLNQRSMPVEKAEMMLYISTESWRYKSTWFFGIPWETWCYGENDLTARWDIEIVVNEESGEDGAPAPRLSFRIVPEQPFPSTLAALEGMQLHDREETLSEGSYGNDAPSLENNALRFGPWLDEHHLIVTWSAEYDDWGSHPRQRASMLFHGPVEFKGIQMKVKQDEDAARFLQKALPALDQQGLEII